SANAGVENLVRAGIDHIMGWLTKPVKPEDLALAIHFAVLRFQQYQKVEQEAAGLRQALADRKIVERAKGVIMRKAGIDEEAAFRRLQRLASDSNQKLVEIARTILLTEETFAVDPG